MGCRFPLLRASGCGRVWCLFGARQPLIARGATLGGALGSVRAGLAGGNKNDVGAGDSKTRAHLPCQLWRHPNVGKGELLLGMVLELIHQPVCVCVLSLFACFTGDGQVVFSLYRSECFKAAELRGCRCRLLSVPAHDSWLDLGLFFSCDTGSVHRTLHLVRP